MLVERASDLPNLSAGKLLCLDLETYDPTLLKLGPGVRREGYPIGIAVGTEDGSTWYVPIRHEQGENIDPDKAWKWVADSVGDRPVVGANIGYDLDYALEAGMPMPRQVRDVLQAARLLDMQVFGAYPSLDWCLREFLGESKTGEDLWVWLATNRGKGAATSKAQIGFIKDAPVELVAEYAEGDVRLLPKLLGVLEDKLKERHAWEWFMVESELLPYLIRMRRRGIRVDVARAERLQTEFGDEYAKLLERFGGEAYPDIWKKLTGSEKTDLLNVNSGAKIARVFQSRGIKLPKTQTGLPSVTKPWLAAQEDPFSKMVLRLRALSKVSGTFVESYILKHAINGRIHPELNPLFPRTLRFSSRNPNEQNIPSRDEVLAPMIRGLFLPEEGEDWGRLDYSQQEYRLLCHFAVGDGADKARAAYQDDPATNFHKLVHSWLPQVGSLKRVKDANFAKTYRAGKPRFASVLGIPRAEGDEIYALYDRTLPFVGQTGKMAEQIASKRGYLRLLLKGYRMYFDHWAVDDWDLRNQDPSNTVFAKTFKTRGEAMDAAMAAFPEWEEGRPPKIKKADTYKALNRLIQPSGAQLMKHGMVLVSRSGATDVLGPALVSVHDELGMSVPRSREGREAFLEVSRCLQGADEGESKVPMLIGAEVGENWGALTEIEDLGAWARAPRKKLRKR